MASSPRSNPRKPPQAAKRPANAPKQKADSTLTAAERVAKDAELAEVRKQTWRRVLILVGVLVVPLYVWAALVISAHNK
jgi:hypothetical protein